MRKLVVFKSLAAVLIVTAFFLTFTIYPLAGNDDSLWQKCNLNVSDPMQWLSGEVKQIIYIDGAPSYSVKLNLDNLAGSGHNDSYMFTSYYWQPFSSFELSSQGTIRVEFQLQYDGFASAILNGYTQCRRIELMSSFYVSGVTLYDYTINLNNGSATIPLYYESIKTNGYLETPISYWSDFEIDPSAYFSISFSIPLNQVSSSSYLFLYIYDLGNIIWLEKPGLEESIKNQQSIDNAESMVDDLNKLNQPEPDVDKVFDNIKSDDISVMGGYFTPSNTENNFYILMTSLMVVGVSLGISGYILHGKK